MESHYRINVARLDHGHYSHFFDITATDSRYGKKHVNVVLAELRARFPEPEFEITCHRAEVSYIPV